MPSRRHDALAWVVPRLRRSREVDDPARERARIERWHARLDRSLPTALVPGFRRRFEVVTETLGSGDAPRFPAYVVTPRGRRPDRTLYYVHGGGFVAPIDPVHVRWTTRLATTLGMRVVLPDYPLAPEHTWRDSFDALVDDAARWTAQPGEVVLAGDSAGGGLALAMAQALRDRDASPSRMVLHAPWVDLTTSTPETEQFDEVDPWLFLGKLRLYAEWWAGSPDDLGRPEVSPALADLSGLPPALMLHGTRDLLAPGCRLLVRRAAEDGWDLTSIEEEDLLHVYSLLPGIPEAARAWRQTLAFLGTGVHA